MCNVHHTLKNSHYWTYAFMYVLVYCFSGEIFPPKSTRFCLLWKSDRNCKEPTALTFQVITYNVSSFLPVSKSKTEYFSYHFGCNVADRECSRIFRNFIIDFAAYIYVLCKMALYVGSPDYLVVCIGVRLIRSPMITTRREFYNPTPQHGDRILLQQNKQLNRQHNLHRAPF